MRNATTISMADQSSGHAELEIAVNNERDFPQVVPLHEEQKDCLKNLVAGKDVFAFLPKCFRKSLIFQLFPRIINMLNEQDPGTVSTIIVVTPLELLRSCKLQGEKFNRVTKQAKICVARTE